MSHYVLVHGCWQGAWAWEKLIPYLIAKGHTVEAINLPGREPGRTDFSHITYNDYYSCLKNTLLACQEPVYLVAHSMAGILAAPLQEELPHLIKHLYLIAAYVPTNGDSLLDIAQRYTGSLIPTILEHSIERKTWTLNKARVKEVLYSECTPEIQEWAAAKLQPEPVQPSEEPIHCLYQKSLADKRTYILCEKDLDVDPRAQHDMAQSLPCKLVSIPTGHFPFLSHPEKLANLVSVN